MTTERDARRRLEKAEAEAAAARKELAKWAGLKAVKDARTVRAASLALVLGEGSTVSDHGGCHSVWLDYVNFEVFDNSVRVCVLEPKERSESGSGTEADALTPTAAIKAEIERLTALRAKEWIMRTKQIELAKATAKKIKDLTWP